MRSQDWETIGWENHSWKDLSLIGDERVINLQRTKVYVFSDSVLCLGKIFENPQLNDAWKQRLGWFKSSKYRNFDRIDGEPMEFEWNIFPGFNTLQLCEEVKRLLFRLDETPENFLRKNSIYVDVQRHFLWQERQLKRMCGKCQTRISVRKKIWKRTMVIYWFWFWEKMVLYQWRQSTRSMWQYGRKDFGWIRRKRMSNFPRYEPIVQRSTQKQRTWKTVDTPCIRCGNGWDYFSHNCLCKPAQSLRSSRGDMWRVWIPSRENGETRCDGTIKFLTRAQCDQDRSSIGL